MTQSFLKILDWKWKPWCKNENLPHFWAPAKGFKHRAPDTCYLSCMPHEKSASKKRRMKPRLPRRAQDFRTHSRTDNDHWYNQLGVESHHATTGHEQVEWHIPCMKGGRGGFAQALFLSESRYPLHSQQLHVVLNIVGLICCTQTITKNYTKYSTECSPLTSSLIWLFQSRCLKRTISVPVIQIYADGWVMMVSYSVKSAMRVNE